MGILIPAKRQGKYNSSAMTCRRHTCQVGGILQESDMVYNFYDTDSSIPYRICKIHPQRLSDRYVHVYIYILNYLDR